MKWLPCLTGFILVASGSGVLGQAAAPSAAATNKSQADAIELLRRVIAEQQRNPGKIIRSPTNPVPQYPSSGTVTATSGSRPGRAELEKQFLDGKITAKQYQRAIENLEKNPPPPAPAPAPSPATVRTRAEPKPVVAAPAARKTAPPDKAKAPSVAVSPKAAAGAPARNIPVPAGSSAATPEEDPEQKTLTDVEAKIDEILARRAAIQEAARTNSAASTNALAAGPMTKRQKLDALLRELIQGKITESDYNTRREKVVAEPD